MAFRKLNKGETPVEPECILDVCFGEDMAPCWFIDWCDGKDYA